MADYAADPAHTQLGADAGFGASVPSQAHAMLGGSAGAKTGTPSRAHASMGDGLPSTVVSSGPRITTIVMKAKKVSDGTERRWVVYNTPDNTAAQAPAAYGTLTNIGVDSTLR